jgi:protein gp37
VTTINTESQDTFGEITETWNPVIGCNHQCTYCWAVRLARRLASMGVEPYLSNVFRPTFLPQRLNKRFRRGSTVFVCDMGDLFGEWVPEEWIRNIVDVIRVQPYVRFMFLTKNPSRYLQFEKEFPMNVVLAATIESNRDYGLSRAPKPSERLEAMKEIKHPYKGVVIEPIIDFDDHFVQSLIDIRPIFVYVGYDNYGHKLPEPPLSKTMILVKTLRKFTEVRIGTLRMAWYEQKRGF